MSEVFKYKITSRNPVGFYFCMFLLFVTSMGLWIGWADREKWVFFVILLALLLSLYHYYYVRFEFNIKNISVVSILFFASIFFNQEFGISLLQNLIIYLFICCLRRDYQIQCLNYIVKWFAWLMIPSIIVYVFAQAGVMPSFGILYRVDDTSHVYLSRDYIQRTNYLFYCASDFYGIRFNGPFAEPGHLGMMSAFLLFADGFDFKKRETWILTLTIVLTMSLAGYVLFFIGYLFNKFEQGLIKISFIITVFLGVLIFYLFATFYNGGDNFINEYLFSRLEYDEEKGFVGNNRVFGQIDIYYAAMFTDIHKLLYGYDKATIEYLAWNNSRGTGYVMCMVSHGLIGTILGVLFYVVYSISRKYKKTTLLFLVFVLFMYWQRTYPFWFSWVICFVFGISNRSFLLYENRNFNLYA